MQQEMIVGTWLGWRSERLSGERRGGMHSQHLLALFRKLPILSMHETPLTPMDACYSG